MATRIPTMYGRYYVISLIWRGRQFTFTAYRANLSKMQRPQAQKLCDKMYPGCRVISFHESDATDGPVVLTMESKDCGEGKYYCREDKKCKPIPMGYHEREDGYLVKNEAANPAQQAAIAIDMKKKGKKPKNMTEEGLRAWFGKSSGTTKSGRKVKGWVQVGGKYDGKPCARQPGQKTTPKCVSSSK